MFATASTAEGVVEEGGEEMLGLTQRLPLQGTQMVHPRTLLVAPRTDPDGRLLAHPGLPVLVHEVSRRAWGLRLRRTEQGLALSPLLILPSAHLYCVGVRVVSFRSSIAHPAYTPVYASLSSSRYQRKTRGRADR
jgi:hypothetical protein